MSEQRIEVDHTSDLALLAGDLAEVASEARWTPTAPDPDPVVSMRRHTRARSRSYRAQLPRQSRGQLPQGPAQVLARAGAARAAVTAAQVAELEAAADWAALHPAPIHGDPAEGGEQLSVVTGEGAPGVAEFAIPELALTLGVSTDSARLLLGDAVELAHRLPHCWETLRAGGVPVYKARRVAQATRDLNPDAAAYVDAEVAPYLHAVGIKALEALVETAIWRHDLPRALAEARASLERRGVRIDLDPHPTGGTSDATVEVCARLDRADAIELEAAITDLAHQLLLAGSADTVDVRRSQALGMLARHETAPVIPDQRPAADLEEWDDAPEPTPAPSGSARRREVVLYCHISEAALRGGTGLVRLEGHAAPVTTEQVRDWCAAPGTTTRITVRPVIDLNDTITTGSYEVPATLAEQSVLRDRTCVFPHCGRDARRCDHDHITPHCDHGPTSSTNVAALCRRHHRLKTHHPGWTYQALHPGTYLWTTPHGQRVLRDPAGTHPLP